MRFDNYPDDCPPKDAHDANNEVVYRFIFDKNMSSTGFLSHYDLGKIKEDNCQGRGLSVFTTEEGVLTARQQIPVFRKKKVAMGTLKQGMGKLKNTPARIKNHHTWWIASDASEKPENLFQFVEL